MTEEGPKTDLSLGETPSQRLDAVTRLAQDAWKKILESHNQTMQNFHRSIHVEKQNIDKLKKELSNAEERLRTLEHCKDVVEGNHESLRKLFLG